MRMNACRMFSASPKPTPGDSVDGLGGRFNAASGHVSTEPFHHARGCGAGLRRECAAELAPAHAGRLRQMLAGWMGRQS